MQAEPVLRKSTDVSEAVLKVYDQTAAFESQAAGSAVGFADTASRWILHVQLPPMEPQRRNRHQPCVVRLAVAGGRPIGEYPRIYAVRREGLSHLVPRLFQAVSIP